MSVSQPFVCGALLMANVTWPMLFYALRFLVGTVKAESFCLRWRCRSFSGRLKYGKTEGQRSRKRRGEHGYHFVVRFPYDKNSSSLAGRH